MYDTATHVKMLKMRIRQTQRRREKYRICCLSAVCCLLCATLASLTGTFAEREQTGLPGLYGSMLLHEDAGGYVLVGVLSFSVAAVLTAFCIRLREKRNSADRKQTDETDKRR